MNRSNQLRTGFAALALLCLVSWSAQAESDKPPCKGKDCASAKIAKTQAPNAAKVNKSVSAAKKNTVGEGALRSNKSSGSNKLLPAVKPPAGKGISNNALKSTPVAKNAATPKGDDGKAIGPMSDKK